MTAHNGEYEFKLGDKRLTVCFDWSALSAISEIDHEEPISELAKPLSKVKAEIVAEILACGLKKYHPELDKQSILEMSPPLMRIIMVLDKALTYAYFGNETPEIKKKVSRKKTLSLNPFRWLIK